MHNQTKQITIDYEELREIIRQVVREELDKQFGNIKPVPQQSLIYQTRPASENTEDISQEAIDVLSYLKDHPEVFIGLGEPTRKSSRPGLIYQTRPSPEKIEDVPQEAQDTLNCLKEHPEMFMSLREPERKPNRLGTKPSDTGRQLSALDILASVPGKRAFSTASDVVNYIREERETWET